METGQIEMVNVDTLVAKNHPYEKLKELINPNMLANLVTVGEKELGVAFIKLRRPKRASPFVPFSFNSL